MNHRPIVFLDVETTGTSAQDGRITEVGALRVERGEVTATYRQLINPEQPIPAFITQLTHIDDAMVQDAPTFDMITEELAAFLDDAIFAAHNVNFDYSFLQAEFRRAGGKFAADRFDTVRLARHLFPGYRSYRLDNVISYLGVSVSERHRGFDDAEVLWKLFAHGYERDAEALFRHIDRILKRCRTQTTEPNEPYYQPFDF